MSRRMKVFVSGPYEGVPHVKAKNIKAADLAGRLILAKGHVSFVPHKMTQDWEYDARFTHDDFMCMDLIWLSLCDAILWLGPSPGANLELEWAVRLGLKVYLSIDEIPSD